MKKVKGTAHRLKTAVILYVFINPYRSARTPTKNSRVLTLFGKPEKHDKVWGKAHEETNYRSTRPCTPMIIA